MKKKILSFLTLLCMVTALFPTNAITVSAYTGTKHGDYLYYQIEENGEVTITDCDESATEIDIPAEIEGKKVTVIGDWAFDDCSNLTNITIPESVTTIGDCAFNNCSSLTSVTIPNDVTTIGEGVFSQCQGLTSITIPEGITTIGDFVFYYCNGLTSVTIPRSVTTIKASAFEGCNNLSTVYYNGTNDEWNNILIGKGNYYLTNANRTYITKPEKKTQTTVSDDGTTFTVTPVNIASGNTVILALYNGDTFVEMQSKPYNDDDPFTTAKSYTTAKVMVWDSLESMTPICDVEIVK